MKYLACFPLVFCLFFLLSQPTAAQEPTPTPNFANPYDFQPVDYESEEENITAGGLGDLLSSVSFINRFGSIAVTVWSMLDNFAGGGVLAYLVIILLGVAIIRWVAKFVYNKPGSEKLDGTAVADVAGDVDPDFGRTAKKFISQIKKRPRF